MSFDSTKSLHKTACSPHVSGICSSSHTCMAADVVSDLVLSFFCCCFYAPGDHHRGGGGTRHYGSGHAHPTGRDAAYHHRGAGSRTASGRSRRTVSLQVRAYTYILILHQLQISFLFVYSIYMRLAAGSRER